MSGLTREKWADLCEAGSLRYSDTCLARPSSMSHSAGSLWRGVGAGGSCPVRQWWRGVPVVSWCCLPPSEAVRGPLPPVPSLPIVPPYPDSGAPAGSPEGVGMVTAAGRDRVTLRTELAKNTDLMTLEPR